MSIVHRARLSRYWDRASSHTPRQMLLFNRLSLKRLLAQYRMQRWVT